MRKLSMDELGRVSVEEFHKKEKLPVICILDNIRSQHNIGSIFRTADAFCVEELVLCGITATPPNREISKSALGATESVRWRYEPDSKEAALNLKKAGYKIIAIEQAEGSIQLNQFTFGNDQPVAFIFGNEVNGVDDKVMSIVDACIEIPQFGTKHSFNVSVTAGIVLWDFFKFIKN